jgi:hypothetical protein
MEYWPKLGKNFVLKTREFKLWLIFVINIKRERIPEGM